MFLLNKLMTLLYFLQQLLSITTQAILICNKLDAIIC